MWLTSVNVAIGLGFDELSAASQGVAVGVEMADLAVTSRLISTRIDEVIRSPCHPDVQHADTWTTCKATSNHPCMAQMLACLRR